MVSRDKISYISFSEKHKDVLPLFYWPQWLDTVCEGQWDALIYKENNEVIAVLPYHFKKKYGLSALIAPILTPYCGEFYLSDIDGESKSYIQSAFIKKLPKVFYYNIGLHPLNDQITAYLQNHFKIKTRYTHLIKHNNFEKIYENFNSTVKAHIRKAEKSLKVIKNLDIDSLWNNINQTLTRNRVNIAFDKSMITKIVENFSDRITIYHAVDADNMAHASVLTIEDNHTVYHLLSGRKSDATRGANALIVFHALKDTMAKGKNYDFEGSSISSIATFFRSFGAEVTTFNQVYRSKFSFTDYFLKMIGKF